jgi:hypothetical protein
MSLSGKTAGDVAMCPYCEPRGTRGKGARRLCPGGIRACGACEIHRPLNGAVTLFMLKATARLQTGSQRWKQILPPG